MSQNLDSGVKAEDLEAAFAPASKKPSTPSKPVEKSVSTPKSEVKKAPKSNKSNA